MDLTKAYNLLEIPAGSTENDVQAAYRYMAAVWHPDRFQGNELLRKAAERKLRYINTAFHLISAAEFPVSIASMETVVKSPVCKGREVQDTPGVLKYGRDDSGSPAETARLCQLSALLGLPVPIFGLLIGPLLVWRVKRKSHHYVDMQGKEAVLFQLNMTVGMGLILGLMKMGIVGRVLGMSMTSVATMYDFFRAFQAASAASVMEPFRYPFIIRFSK